MADYWPVPQWRTEFPCLGLNNSPRRVRHRRFGSQRHGLNAGHVGMAGGFSEKWQWDRRGDKQTDGPVPVAGFCIHEMRPTRFND